MDPLILQEITETRDTMNALMGEAALLEEVQRVGALCVEALQRGNKIMFCGNGGSAADSQHLAAELVSKLNFDRPGLAAIALTVDTSALTAIGNDYGFERAFARQVEAIGQEGDILVAISTSGNSANILAALESAKAKGITTVGKTGRKGGKMKDKCDICLCMPSDRTPKVQECHILLGHIYCALIENALFGKSHGKKAA